jgi:hypothetical protein
VNSTQLLLVLLPLIVIQVGLMVLALRDLFSDGRLVRGDRRIWAVIIVFGELLGPVAYFLAGRRDA